MKSPDSILKSMIDTEIGSNPSYTITHHQADNPHRIDVARDETVLIHQINIEVAIDFWLEFHSASESHLIQMPISTPQNVDYEIITRHKGAVNFSRSHSFTYTVKYVRIKIVK
jgi:hypothetical protein